MEIHQQYLGQENDYKPVLQYFKENIHKLELHLPNE